MGVHSPGVYSLERPIVDLGSHSSKVYTLGARRMGVYNLGTYNNLELCSLGVGRLEVYSLGVCSLGAYSLERPTVDLWTTQLESTV